MDSDYDAPYFNPFQLSDSSSLANSSEHQNVTFSSINSSTKSTLGNDNDATTSLSKASDTSTASAIKRKRGPYKKKLDGNLSSIIGSSSTSSSVPASNPEEVVARIKELDLNSIPPFQPSDNSGVKIVVIGKAGVGKSTR